MCCFLTSCCCGWQSLEQGLFILALVDILFNILVIGFNISSTFSGFASLSGALIIADIGLAVGAKLGVKLLILIWLVIFFLEILISVVVPPLVLIALLVVQQVTGNSDSFLFNLVNLDFERDSHIKFYINILIRFIVGFFYIYTWMMARSLFMLIGRVGYSDKMEQGVLVDRSGCKPFSECRDELVRIDDGFRPTSTNNEIKHRNTLQKFRLFTMVEFVHLRTE
ncbi:uncharacterized protein LOC111698090 isoform X2 [Eurytemora carolleeae]|uniref:uncharacterized protein LOC111698090 isoform X2 n=1 Tax=Eurytemora carolleeae TaxID=1294199 RepID=UPI000C7742A5|nr:uncharacterized protein LOC111698090 isoform X2 [Eurytemora carolleeae]|eukprot:XP_023324099.1 uncharacterized protein LOC111698090 isoform X2 [Eurytemora affinis]